MNDVWLNRLSEVLDDSLSLAERAEAEAHLRACEACAQALEELRRVRARAGSLSDLPVPEGLWHGIEARIAPGRTVPFPAAGQAEQGGAGRSGRTAGRISLSLPQLIAACLAVALVSGGTVFALLQGRAPKGGGAVTGTSTRASAPIPSSEPSRSAETAAGDRAAREDRSAPEEPSRDLVRSEGKGAGQAVLASTSRLDASPEESPQEAAIADLRKALARGRDRLDPATIRTLESNLAIIELAIEQGKRALAADPSNTYVKEHLADTMRRKVELLQRATVLASTSPEGSR